MKDNLPYFKEHIIIIYMNKKGKIEWGRSYFFPKITLLTADVRREKNRTVPFKEKELPVPQILYIVLFMTQRIGPVKEG